MPADFLKFEDFPEFLLPSDAKTLIKQMVVVEPTERITIEQVLDSPFFEAVKDL